MSSRQPDLKTLTARSIKWNMIDRVASMLLYLSIGIILARELSPAQFGLVSTVMAFQAFASLFIDSGFSYALIQRHKVTRLDYSSVLWFNIAVAVAAYMGLWFLSGAIAHYYNEPILKPLGRVAFTSFLFNAATLVQQTRLMKQQNVAPIAAANTLSLTLAGGVAVWGALAGWGAWAPVAQTVLMAALKCIILWCYTRWLPVLKFSWTALKSFMKVGTGMMLTSLLNTIFLQVYALVIGKRAGMGRLGYYYQAEKWSKMGIQSISQTLTQSFLPTLATVSDEPARFVRSVVTMNRTGSYLLFPAMGLLAVVTPALFHVLFGNKWDYSIVLFQILLLRGLFTSLTQLYNNYAIALGQSRTVLKMEAVRDSIAGIALIASLPVLNLETPGHPVMGIEILLWGQTLAAALAWLYTLWTVAPRCGFTLAQFVTHSLPAASLTLVSMALAWLATTMCSTAWLQLAAGVVAGAGCYILLNRVFKIRAQSDIVAFLLKR